MGLCWLGIHSNILYPLLAETSSSSSLGFFDYRQESEPSPVTGFIHPYMNM